MNLDKISTNIGIIGFGNMGSALAKGLVKVTQKPSSVYIYARGQEKQKQIKALGATPVPSLQELAERTELIILATKPDQAQEALQNITAYLAPYHVLVSIAAGLTLAKLKEFCRGECPVVRIMPNTLVAAGKGLFGLCFDDQETNTKLSQENKELVRQVFAKLGTCVELPESKINAFSALAGCGPAYVFYFMEALIEAGVSMGLDRKSSQSIAYSLCAGSVALAEKDGVHPSILREQVCSPAGMTIAGTNTLDKHRVRSAIVEAVQAAKKRGEDMAKEMEK